QWRARQGLDAGLQPTGFRLKVAMNGSWRRRPGRHDCPEAARLPFTGSDQAPERGLRRVRRGWRIDLNRGGGALHESEYRQNAILPIYARRWIFPRSSASTQDAPL